MIRILSTLPLKLSLRYWVTGGLLAQAVSVSAARIRVIERNKVGCFISGCRVVCVTRSLSDLGNRNEGKAF